MKCPVCGVVYRPTKEAALRLTSTALSTSRSVTKVHGGETDSNTPPSLPVSSATCRRCKADLSDLLSLHDQAIWYHRQALHLLSKGHYLEATTQNNQALALYYSNADFHALAGKLSALQGEWREAIASWQQALKFDPQNAIACDCLQMIKLMAQNYR